MKPDEFAWIKYRGILLILFFFCIKPVMANTILVLNSALTIKTDTFSGNTYNGVPHAPAPTLRILFFGDSMAGALNKRMRQYAHHNGIQLLNIVWYSSTTKLWAQTDTLSYYLRRFHPNYVLICLGSNELFIRNPHTRKVYIRKILQNIGNVPYIWIAPPNWKKDTGINRLIEEQTGKWRYYPSWKLSFERKKDGAHPTPNSSSQWMDSIAKWIMNESCYPIRMTCPDKNTPQTGKTVILSPQKSF